MKINIIALTLAALMGVALGTGVARSDDQPTPKAEPADDSVPKQPDFNDPAFVERITKIISPGPMHKRLEHFVGSWDVKISAGDKEAGNAVSTFAWKIPGRWVTEDLNGALMGKPYHGFGIHGYDNYTKNWLSTLVSNQDTAILNFSGVVVDPKHKVMTLYGRMNEYYTDTFNKPIRTVLRHTDKDNFVVEVWDMQIGESGQAVLTYHYARQKKAAPSK